jgi:O-antigen/teichoic acid export membrane protein
VAAGGSRIVMSGRDAIDGRVGREGSLAENAAWLMLGKTLGFAFTLALPLLLVRILNQHDFALYKQAFLVVNTAVWVLPLGFGMSAFYFLPREGERRGAVVFNVLMFDLVMGGAACLALAWWPGMLGALFKAPEIVDYAPLIGLVVLIGVVSSFIEIVVIANQETRLATVLIVLSQFTKSALLLAATVAFGTVRALLVAAIVQGTLQTLVLLLYLRSRFGAFWRRPSWAMLREQLTYALPLGLSGLLLIAHTDAHNYFVASRYDPATFAIYAIGCFQLPLISLLAESVGAVLIPRASVLQKAGDLREIVLLTGRVMRKLSAVYFPIYAFVLVLGREFVTAVFTEQYAASWPILAINMAILPFSVVALDPIVRAFTELSHLLLRMRALIVGLQMVALWFVTARYGLVATIAVVAGSKIAEQVILTWRAARALHVKRGDVALLKDLAGVTLVAAGAAAVGAGVRVVLAGQSPWTILVVGGTAFGLTYAIGLWFSGVMTDAERQEVVRRWKVLRQQILPRRIAESQAS